MLHAKNKENILNEIKLKIALVFQIKLYQLKNISTILICKVFNFRLKHLIASF